MTVLVLFDIDGTLLRAGDPVHTQAMETALREVFGVPATLDGVPLGGMLDRQIARLALAPHQVDPTTLDEGLAECMDRLGRHYRSLVAPTERRSWLLPGVAGLLEALARDRRALVGTLTGNAEGVGRHKLMAAGLDGLVRVGAWGCEADDRADLVPLARGRATEVLGGSEPTSTLLIGDTPRDVDAAHDAGCPIIAVATGRWSVADLASAGADEVLDDLTTESALLARLIDAAAHPG
ncbi:MAG: HAD family hydrolase [Acidimicrobiales bacterium]|nr:HAD family hydrolase [Acidimicrobiales bacterium]